MFRFYRSLFLRLSLSSSSLWDTRSTNIGIVKNRRQEQRIIYLISVYRAFSKANHHPRLYEVADELEQAVADVQLFGSPKQVRLARQFATDLGTKQAAEMDDLLIELQRSLPAELVAEALSGRLVCMRVGRKLEDRERESESQASDDPDRE